MTDQTAPQHRVNTTFLPPGWPTTPGFFDDAVDDANNFGLDENSVAFLVALLSTLSLLLLNDLFFRVLVRARRGERSHAVKRRHALIARFSNPLLWFSRSPRRRDVFADANHPMPSHTVHSVGAGASGPAPKAGMYVFYVQPLLFSTAGLLLIAGELLLLFLSTNRGTAYDLDLSAFPTHAALPPGPEQPLLLASSQECLALPLVARPGFETELLFYRCSTRSLTVRSTASPPGTARVRVGSNDGLASIQVDVLNFTLSEYPYTQTIIPNGTIYTPPTMLRPPDVVAALGAALGTAANQVPWERPANVPEQFRMWGIQFEMNVSALQPPEPFASSFGTEDTQTQTFNSALPEGARANVTQMAALRVAAYLAALARTTLSLNATARAASRDFDASGARVEAFLDEVQTPALVTCQRPWLHVAAAIGLASSLLVLWLGVALGLRWQPGPDYGAVWRAAHSLSADGADGVASSGLTPNAAELVDKNATASQISFLSP